MSKPEHFNFCVATAQAERFVRLGPFARLRLFGVTITTGEQVAVMHGVLANSPAYHGHNCGWMVVTSGREPAAKIFEHIILPGARNFHEDASGVQLPLQRTTEHNERLLELIYSPRGAAPPVTARLDGNPIYPIMRPFVSVPYTEGITSPVTGW